MIVRGRLKKSERRSLDEWLTGTEFYTIESVVDHKTRYAASQDQFCIMRKGDAMACDIEEMPTMAEYFRNEIRAEILDLYEELKSLRRAHRKYYEPAWKREYKNESAYN